MAKVINFKNVPVELRIGEAEPTDMRRSVGNAINRNTSDIALADFARKIFYSTEPIEIPVEFIPEITRIVTRDEYLLAPAKTAVLGLIQETMGATPIAPVEDNTNIKPLKRKRK